MADEEIRDEIEEIEEVDEVELDPKDKQLQDKEQMIGRQSSEIGELRKQLEAAQLIQQQAMMNQQQYGNFQAMPTTDANPYQDADAQFFETPTMVAKRIAREEAKEEFKQTYQHIKHAENNKEYGIDCLRTEPGFAQLLPELKRELGGVDDQYFQDPVSAKATVEAVFERVLGKTHRQLRSQTVDPKARLSTLEALGVASPSTSAEDNSDHVSSKDMEMLKSMGITGKKLQSIVTRFTNTEEE